MLVIEENGIVVFLQTERLFFNGQSGRAIEISALMRREFDQV